MNELIVVVVVVVMILLIFIGMLYVISYKKMARGGKKGTDYCKMITLREFSKICDKNGFKTLTPDDSEFIGPDDLFKGLYARVINEQAVNLDSSADDIYVFAESSMFAGNDTGMVKNPSIRLLKTEEHISKSFEPKFFSDCEWNERYSSGHWYKSISTDIINMLIVELDAPINPKGEYYIQTPTSLRWIRGEQGWYAILLGSKPWASVMKNSCHHLHVNYGQALLSEAIDARRNTIQKHVQTDNQKDFITIGAPKEKVSPYMAIRSALVDTLNRVAAPTDSINIKSRHIFVRSAFLKHTDYTYSLDPNAAVTKTNYVKFVVATHTFSRVAEECFRKRVVRGDFSALEATRRVKLFYELLSMSNNLHALGPKDTEWAKIRTEIDVILTCSKLPDITRRNDITRIGKLLDVAWNFKSKRFYDRSMQEFITRLFVHVDRWENEFTDVVFGEKELDCAMNIFHGFITDKETISDSKYIDRFQSTGENNWSVRLNNGIDAVNPYPDGLLLRGGEQDEIEAGRERHLIRYNKSLIDLANDGEGLPRIYPGLPWLCPLEDVNQLHERQNNIIDFTMDCIERDSLGDEYLNLVSEQESMMISDTSLAYQESFELENRHLLDNLKNIHDELLRDQCSLFSRIESIAAASWKYYELTLEDDYYLKIFIEQRELLDRWILNKVDISVALREQYEFEKQYM